MQVVRSANHAPRVAEVLEQLLEQARIGQLVSIAFVVEAETNKDAHCGIEGRWRADPARLLGELELMKDRIARYANKQRGFGT